tara:strand:+ start:312 stop:503 length:192 start_codon:yes stop_codon:yes gene_type:complete
MAWKLKEQYKDTVIPNFKTPLNKLKPHQIEGLYDHLKEAYFEEVKSISKKKKQKRDDSFEGEI